MRGGGPSGAPRVSFYWSHSRAPACFPPCSQTHVFGDKSAVTAHLAGSAEEAYARAAWEEQERRRKAELRAEATETSPELLARDVPGL